MDVLSDCPTFIDLRDFASNGVARVQGDPFGLGRNLLPIRPAPVEIGSIHLDAGVGSAAAMPGDNFLVVVSGEVTLTTPSDTVRLRSGESCVIGSGTAFDWVAPVATVLVFMRYLGTAKAAPGIIAIDAAAQLTPSGAPLAELLVGETPSCRNHTSFTSADGEFMCGVWDSTPYYRRSMGYRHFELMVLLDGSVTFVDELKHSRTYSKGDIFLIEQGAHCSWESREDVAKIYAIYRPAA
ncbi:MAG: cupin domain-containing protein [Sphingomicrobium sp.]